MWISQSHVMNQARTSLSFCSVLDQLLLLFSVAEDPEDGTQEQLLAGEIDQLLTSVGSLFLECIVRTIIVQQ